MLKVAGTVDFGTAHLHKKYGSPLRYMRPTGKGSQFLTETIKRIDPELKRIMSEGVTDPLKIAIREYITREFEKVESFEVAA